MALAAAKRQLVMKMLPMKAMKKNDEEEDKMKKRPAAQQQKPVLVAVVPDEAQDNKRQKSEPGSPKARAEARAPVEAKRATAAKSAAKSAARPLVSDTSLWKGDLMRWCGYQLKNNTSQAKAAQEIKAGYDSANDIGTAAANAFAKKFYETKSSNDFGWTKTFADDFVISNRQQDSQEIGYKTLLRT